MSSKLNQTKQISTRKTSRKEDTTLNLNDKEKSVEKDTWENQIMKRSCKDFKNFKCYK